MSETVATVRDAYSLLATLWCSPRDQETDVVERAGAILAEFRELEPMAAAALERFLKQQITEEEYVDLFELDPQCALYLGSHSFDEPTTCAQAGVCDRNGYMIELVGVYRHMGLIPSPEELPDYLPVMVEFLALTSDSEDPIREKLIRECMLPFLPPFRKRLAELDSHYAHLADSLELLLQHDAGIEPAGENLA